RLALTGHMVRSPRGPHATRHAGGRPPGQAAVPPSSSRTARLMPPSITLNMMRVARPRSLPQLHLGVLPHLLQEFQVLPHAEQVITRDPVPVGTFLNFLLNLDILLFAYRVESYAVAYVRALNRFLEAGVPLL